MFRALLLVLLATVVSCGGPTEPTLRIATAANARFLMEDLIKEFEFKTGIPCEMVVGSSGKLYAQIAEGAPLDVFVSADHEYNNRLYAKDRSTWPKLYAQGVVVMYSAGKKELCHPDSLVSERIKHVAIANPEIAPYGQASVELLKHLGVYDQIKHKLVFGESISQTSQMIQTGAAEVGFTSLSYVKAGPLSEGGHWHGFPATWSEPILQGISAVGPDTNDLNDAKRFVDFVLSEEMGYLFDRYGYLRPE